MYVCVERRCREKWEERWEGKLVDLLNNKFKKGKRKKELKLFLQSLFIWKVQGSWTLNHLLFVCSSNQHLKAS